MWNKNKIEKHPQNNLVCLCFSFCLFSSKPNIDKPLPRHLALCTGPLKEGKRRFTAGLLLLLFQHAWEVLKKPTLSTKKKKKFSYHKESFIGKTETLRQKSYKNKYRPITFPTFYLHCRITHITVIMTHKQREGQFYGKLVQPFWRDASGDGCL